MKLMILIFTLLILALPAESDGRTGSISLRLCTVAYHVWVRVKEDSYWIFSLMTDFANKDKDHIVFMENLMTAYENDWISLTEYIDVFIVALTSLYGGYILLEKLVRINQGLTGGFG